MLEVKLKDMLEALLKEMLEAYQPDTDTDIFTFHAKTEIFIILCLLNT